MQIALPINLYCICFWISYTCCTPKSIWRYSVPLPYWKYQCYCNYLYASEFLILAVLQNLFEDISFTPIKKRANAFKHWLSCLNINSYACILSLRLSLLFYVIVLLLSLALLKLDCLEVILLLLETFPLPWSLSYT